MFIETGFKTTALLSERNILLLRSEVDAYNEPR